jgi:multiple sugar transport system substrate-binding protein
MSRCTTTRLRLLVSTVVLSAGLATPSVAQQKVTLTFVRAGDSATVAKVFDPMLRAFEADNPGVTIKSIPMGFDEANRRFPLMAATGELPDVVAPPESLSATLGADGAFLPLKDRLSKELVDDVPKDMWSFPCAAPTGELVGVPANAGGTVLWYNANVFKAAGLDPDKPPQTWDEFIAAARQIEEKTDSDGLGLNGFARNDIMDTYQAIVGSRSGEWYWDDKTKAVKVNAANADALDFLGKLVKDGLTQSSVESYNRADTRSLLRDGKVAMTFDGPWAIGVLNKAVPDVTAASSPYRTTRMPGMKEPGGTSLSISCYNVSATTKQPEMAIKLVEFLSQPKNMLTHAQGYGVLPVRTSVLRSDTFAGQPWKALAEAAANKTFPAKPAIKELSLVENSIPSAIQSVLLGKATGKDALAKLAKQEGWSQ